MYIVCVLHMYFTSSIMTRMQGEVADFMAVTWLFLGSNEDLRNPDRPGSTRRIMVKKISIGVN